MEKFNIGLVVFLLIVAGIRPCLAGPFSPVYMDITVGGEQRNFGYYVPDSYDPSTPTPLLFMFHGAGGNNSEASGGSAENGYYGWQTSADQNGFIVLFPKKECCFGFNLWSLSSNSVDLDFVDEMIDWATSNYNIRTTHIFTTGHSYGAYFSYCVARWRSDDIAAFAEHSGGLSSIPVPTGPTPTPKLNAILLHAVDDGIVNYSGSQNLYDALVANGHNVYNDGIGSDGIIEVDGWGPDNHRYRKVHNQTQWDFFMSQAALIDRDTDGLPDSWELQIIDADLGDGIISINHVSPTDDFNGDGISNIFAYMLDLDPVNAVDPALLPSTRINGGELGIDFSVPDTVPAGVNYRVEYSTDLNAWSEVGRLLFGSVSWTTYSGASVTVTPAGVRNTIELKSGVSLSTQPRQFLRLQAELP